MAQTRGVYETDPGPRYERAVADAHKRLQRAADEWTAGQLEQPSPAKVLGSLLDLFQKRKFLHLPFRVAIDPDCLSWNSGIIPNLARAIHDERNFERLPILANALEEAGCVDTGLLGHCREGKPHVLSCWVVEVLVGNATSSGHLLPRKGVRGISTCEAGSRYEECVTAAHGILKEAAQGWTEGDPEDPCTGTILKGIRDLFLKHRFLRLPFGAGPT